MTVTNAQWLARLGDKRAISAARRRRRQLYSVAALDSTVPITNFISDQYLQEAPALTNALISNNSWNYGGDSAYDLAAASYDAAVRDALPAVTGSQPVLFVFAAGNDGGGGERRSGAAIRTPFCRRPRPRT